MELPDITGGVRFGLVGKPGGEFLQHAFRIAILRNSDEPGTLIGWHSGRSARDELWAKESALPNRPARRASNNLPTGDCQLYKGLLTAMAYALLSSGRRLLSRSTISSRAMSSKAPLLISPKELHELKSSSNVSLLDTSWHMPNSPRNAQAEFLAKRIPGARYLDLDKVASPHYMGLKHMMPSDEIFASALSAQILLWTVALLLINGSVEFGITPDSHVVLYAILSENGMLFD